MRHRIWLALALVPLLIGWGLTALYTPARAGVALSGALVFATLPLPLQPLPVSQAQVHAWLVLLSLAALSRALTAGTDGMDWANTRRGQIACWLVARAEGLVQLGGLPPGYAPLAAALMALSAGCSLLPLLGLYAPTADLTVPLGWALLVFALITWRKARGGLRAYARDFTRPVPLLTPLNVLSELSNPAAMAFRQYGNVLSGAVMAALTAAGLQRLSARVLGWLPGALGAVPLLQIGLPALLSAYFDLFSGLLQAYLFAVLTVLYVGAPAAESTGGMTT